MQTSFAFAASEPQLARADLASATMLAVLALYSAFDRVCAIAPVLNARPIAIATALMLRFFTFVPSRCRLEYRRAPSRPPRSGWTERLHGAADLTLVFLPDRELPLGFL